MDIELLARQFYEYSESFRGYSKVTTKRYNQAIRFYCTFAKITKIEEVTDDNIRAFFLHGRTQLGWKPNTFIAYYKSLKVFFRWCKERGFLTRSICQDLEVPKLEKVLPKRLPKQNALHLLEVVYNLPYNNSFERYRNHAIFSMFIFAGIRKKELLRLRFTDVDIENRTIFINQGKGSKDRCIPMSFTLAQSLQRYIDVRKSNQKSCPAFFTSFQNNAAYNETALKRLVDKVRTIAGIPFTIHRLRHTFATLMLEGGCDIYSLSKMMGHSDIKTTTIYLSASVEHLRMQISKHPLSQTA